MAFHVSGAVIKFSIFGLYSHPRFVSGSVSVYGKPVREDVSTDGEHLAFGIERENCAVSEVASLG